MGMMHARGLVMSRRALGKCTCRFMMPGLLHEADASIEADVNLMITAANATYERAVKQPDKPRPGRCL
jgi:hypothetical protein